MPLGTNPFKATLDEWKAGTLHSGSKSGPRVTNQKQAVAIGFSQAKKAGRDTKGRKVKR